jgi:predicted anti-sigma-YlaC factor YlaD
MPKLLLFVCIISSSACLRQVVVASAADALASSGTGGGAFARDDDPELVGDALPFALKTMEALLDETPDHRGLLIGLAAGFVQYAQGFVLPRGRDADFAQSEHIRKRVRKLHLRGHRYGLRALELDQPGFRAAVEKDAVAAVADLDKNSVDALYWSGAGLAAAISLSADDMSMVARLPWVDAFMQRALTLDADWGDGALHEFFITYEGRSEAMGGSPQRAQQHFDRAVVLTGGHKASPYVALVEAVAIKNQDKAMFDRLLDQALAIDLDANPDFRLANEIAQSQARWLKAHVEDFIL